MQIASPIIPESKTMIPERISISRHRLHSVRHHFGFTLPEFFQTIARDACTLNNHLPVARKLTKPPDRLTVICKPTVMNSVFAFRCGTSYLDRCLSFPIRHFLPVCSFLC